MSTQDQSQTSGGEDLGDLDIDFTYEILPDDFLQYDLSFKIIVIGDSGVGKSCLTNRATTNLFEDTYNATVGFEFLSFNVKIDEKVIKLQIWDTCGQELYRSLITNFYRNSSLAIIVYAINSKDSFEDIEMWLRELRTHSNPDAKVFLIGNKLDLENERKITKEQGETFAKNNKLNLFIEASAKTGFNSKKIFIKAAKMLYDEHLKYKDVENKVEIDGDSDIIAKKKDNMKLDENKKKDKGGCC
jgi:small GTP-binding protein